MFGIADSTWLFSYFSGCSFTQHCCLGLMSKDETSSSGFAGEISRPVEVNDSDSKSSDSKSTSSGSYSRSVCSDISQEAEAPQKNQSKADAAESREKPVKNEKSSIPKDELEQPQTTVDTNLATADVTHQSVSRTETSAEPARKPKRPEPEPLQQDSRPPKYRHTEHSPKSQPGWEAAKRPSVGDPRSYSENERMEDRKSAPQAREPQPSTETLRKVEPAMRRHAADDRKPTPPAREAPPQSAAMPPLSPPRTGAFRRVERQLQPEHTAPRSVSPHDVIEDLQHGLDTSGAAVASAGDTRTWRERWKASQDLVDELGNQLIQERMMVNHLQNRLKSEQHARKQAYGGARQANERIAVLLAEKTSLEGEVFKLQRQLKMERRAWDADELQLSDKLMQYRSEADKLRDALQEMERAKRKLQENLSDERHLKEKALSFIADRSQRLTELETQGGMHYPKEPSQ
mmetsp:Transcript_20163/g.48009  ORF Transcript_20163/g.48009 Transcript_20163/m.48009 type:complete len:460 (-) Transcript_20163:464-1843(-)